MLKIIKADIITIGDELLIGQVIDTNSSWIGQQLNKIGITINKKIVIGDNESQIIKTIENCTKEVEIIIITGGLGPTKDDITKKTLANFFEDILVENEQVILHLEKFFESRGRTLLEINKQQALVPSKCFVLQNDLGTAPGMMFETPNNGLLFSIPGVPYEMEYIMQKHILPIVLKKYGSNKIIHETIYTYNIPESLLSQKIEHIENFIPENIKLAYLPNHNLVRLRLTGNEAFDVDAHRKILDIKKQITDCIKSNVLYEEDITPMEFLVKKLKEKKKRIALAESCTGGYLSSLITQIPNVSDIFIGGIISYDNKIKTLELNVPEEILITEGAVSENCVKIMAESIRKKFDTEISIAISGIAGPSGGTENKPVGTVYVAVSVANNTLVRRFNHFGDRVRIIQRTSNSAIAMALEMLNKV